MGTYFTSGGERLSQRELNERIGNACKKKIYDQKYDHDYNFCEQCGRSAGTWFDCSHIVSRKKAKDNRQAELCYDLNNLRVLCRSCHQEYDKLKIEW